VIRSGEDIIAARSDVPPAAGTSRALAATTLALVVGGVLAARAGGLSFASLGTAAGLWLVVCALVHGHRAHHPHRRFGTANTVTTVRAAITTLLAAFALEAGDPSGALRGGAASAGWAWFVTGLAALALVLDGIDGALARASGLVSAFGARYDMEIDALLALVLALLVWRSGELGPWVLALGTLRYLFLAAAVPLPALRAPLFPSLRRKAVCVVQIAALCAIVSPLLEPPLSSAIGLAATLALALSFGRDVHWLLGRGRLRSGGDETLAR